MNPSLLCVISDLFLRGFFSSPSPQTLIFNFYGYALSLGGSWTMLLAARVSGKVHVSQPH